MEVDPDRRRSFVFVYGTLKRGFPNHGFIEDLVSSGDASFVSACRTALRLPLVLGPFSIPFLLNLPGSGRRISGELFAVSAPALDRVDELEGTRRGHYERLRIAVVPAAGGGEERSGDEEDEHEGEVVEAEAYFAHRSYADEMWRRSGEKGLGFYSKEDARMYIRPKDRPLDFTFLGELRKFFASQD